MRQDPNLGRADLQSLELTRSATLSLSLCACLSLSLPFRPPLVTMPCSASRATTRSTASTQCLSLEISSPKQLAIDRRSNRGALRLWRSRLSVDRCERVSMGFNVKARGALDNARVDVSRARSLSLSISLWSRKKRRAGRSVSRRRENPAERGQRRIATREGRARVRDPLTRDLGIDSRALVSAFGRAREFARESLSEGRQAGLSRVDRRVARRPTRDGRIGAWGGRGARGPELLRLRTRRSLRPPRPP